MIISRRQISFNACDQVWNADWLGKECGCPWICSADFASAFVTRAVRKTTGVRCDVGSDSIRAASSPPSASGIAISLDRKFTRRFSRQLVSVSKRTSNKANPKRRGALITTSANSLIGCHSGIHNRGHRSNRTCRIHSNRTGNSRNRNIRTDSPSPTTPESRSRRRR